MSLEQKVSELVSSSDRLTQVTQDSVGRYQQMIDQNISQIPRKIVDAMSISLYVDGKNGHDENDGSQAHPLKSLFAAIRYDVPYHAFIRIYLLSDIALDRDIGFAGRHIQLFLNNHTLKFPARSITDAAGTVVGSAIYKILGARDTSLFIQQGTLETSDCISSGKGDQWFFRVHQTMVQMGGIDYDNGIFPVSFNRLNIKLGKYVTGLCAGSAGRNSYPGEGVVVACQYLTTADVTADGAVLYGKGVHFRNNTLYDYSGHQVQVVSA
ncbi:hypothetical protein [Vibrio mangrovi]|uniref:Uncharacterized protein n=1 Tax=Vibrio mangrovi TaxID=474394 RepID=A0A1Y6IVH9_9VIBR|nr:hypothetical protein [Vibrio mangrovi]MDW6004720.1 hypothetical protein [Vibrio mangrovi]SMS01011.1 hypothetical protein VIM7927_02288 [Vibrio mangrovi]